MQAGRNKVKLTKAERRRYLDEDQRLGWRAEHIIRDLLRRVRKLEKKVKELCR